MRRRTVVLAFNAFKGTLTAREACTAAARGARGWRVVHRPMADGGDGTAQVLKEVLCGKWRSVRVCGPLGQPVRARFLHVPDRKLAVIEMATASGYALVPPAFRNPLDTTTHGTGELILAAIRAGARTILIGVGGSATVDGGAGALQALGAQFTGPAGKPLQPPMNGGILQSISAADLSAARRSLRGVRIEVLCDVRNPLLGRNGAAPVFAPQKGATPAAVKSLERGLRQLAATALKRPLAAKPFTGAAGGLAFGLAAVGAKLLPGARAVARLIALEDAIKSADLVLTGEGAADTQTLEGKAPAEVGRLARLHRVPCVLLAGRVTIDTHSLTRAGFTSAFALATGGQTPEDARASSALHLTNTVAEVFRLAEAFSKPHK